MPNPTSSGAISMSEINQALGRSATAAIDFNDSLVRFISDSSSGSVSMSSMRNRYFYSGTVTVASLYDPKAGYFGYGFASGLGAGSVTGTIGGQTINVLYTRTSNGGTAVFLNADPPPFTTSSRFYAPASSNAAYQTLTYDHYSLPGWYNTSAGYLFVSGNVGGTYSWYLSN
jgi:hypothetical protein